MWFYCIWLTVAGHRKQQLTVTAQRSSFLKETNSVLLPRGKQMKIKTLTFIDIKWLHLFAKPWITYLFIIINVWNLQLQRRTKWWMSVSYEIYYTNSKLYQNKSKTVDSCEFICLSVGVRRTHNNPTSLSFPPSLYRHRIHPTQHNKYIYTEKENECSISR